MSCNIRETNYVARAILGHYDCKINNCKYRAKNFKDLKEHKGTVHAH